MDEPMAHADNIGPWNAGTFLAAFLRNFERRFTDNFDLFYQSQNTHSISIKIAPVFACRKRYCFPGRIQHVPQPYGVITVHTGPQRSSQLRRENIGSGLVACAYLPSSRLTSWRVHVPFWING